MIHRERAKFSLRDVAIERVRVSFYSYLKHKYKRMEVARPHASQLHLQRKSFFSNSGCCCLCLLFRSLACSLAHSLFATFRCVSFPSLRTIYLHRFACMYIHTYIQTAQHNPCSICFKFTVKVTYSWHALRRQRANLQQQQQQLTLLAKCMQLAAPLFFALFAFTAQRMLLRWPSYYFITFAIALFLFHFNFNVYTIYNRYENSQYGRSVYRCGYVCMYLSTYVHIFDLIYICTYVCMCICIFHRAEPSLPLLALCIQN